MRIKKGDQIQVIAGKDKGKSGKVLRIIPGSLKVVAEGLNIVKKHSKPKRGGEKGQRVEIPSPINVSKVMLVCPKCGKATKVEFKLNGENKSRICKKCKGEL